MKTENVLKDHSLFCSQIDQRTLVGGTRSAVFLEHTHTAMLEVNMEISLYELFKATAVSLKRTCHSLLTPPLTWDHSVMHLVYHQQPKGPRTTSHEYGQ